MRGFSTVVLTFRMVPMVMNGEHGGRCRRHVATTTALVVAVLGTVSCGGAGDTPGSMGGVTPAPSVVTTNSTATPSSDGPRFVKATATPVPGTKEDALFLEAKKVYETYLDEIYKLEVEGVGDSLSPELKEILSEDGADATFKAYMEAEKRGHRALPLDRPFRDVKISRVAGENDFGITILGCADFSAWRFKDSKDDKVISGRIRRDKRLFPIIGGRRV